MEVFYGDRNLKNSQIFAAIAQDFDVKGQDVTRANIQFKLGASKLALMVQQQKPTANGLAAGAAELKEERERRTGALISYSYPIQQWTLLGQYQTLEDDSIFNLGVDYHFSKQTKIYFWHAAIDREGNDTNNYLALGFQHKLSKHF